MLTSYVERMFPISFARKDLFGARSLSESNLISWLQHFSPNSSVPHSFVVNESIPETFGLPEYEKANMFVEFIIGGYYVKLSDRYFTSELTGFTTEGEKVTPYYASIKFRTNGDHEYFRTLEGAETTVGEETHFNALQIGKTIPNDAAYVLHLFDLKQVNTGSGDTQVKKVEYVIPRTSLSTIDGGEI